MRLWSVIAFAAIFLISCTSSSPTANNTPVPPSPSLLPPPKPSPTAAATPASITGIPMPGGEVGIAYTATLTASGGGTPYSWGLDSGSLPPGLTLGSDGGVSGAPSAAGTFAFTVKATDSQNQYTTQGATIKIVPHLAATLIPACAQHCSVEQGCVNVCGNFGSQSGGVGPFSYSAAGNIPGGMKVSGLSLAGSFPNVAQFWQFTVTITDALGATASVSPIFYVYQHIRFTQTSGVCAASRTTTACQVQLSYAGGTPGGKPTVKIIAVTGYGGTGSATISGLSQLAGCSQPVPTTKPPSWGTLSAAGGILTYSLATIPSNYCNYTGRIVIELVDQSPCGSPQFCTSNTATIDIRV